MTNDHEGGNPVAVFVDGNTRVIHVFLRNPIAGVNRSDNIENFLGPLIFEMIVTDDPIDSHEMRDIETGSTWDIEIGVATKWPLKGTVLKRAPYVTAFDWAWEDFNPHTKFYGDNS